MAVGTQDEERSAAGGRVQFLDGRIAAGLVFVQPVAGDPIVRSLARGHLGEAGEQGLAALDPVRAQQFPGGEAGGVGVGVIMAVDDAGDCGAPAQVDDLRLRTDQRFDGVVAAQGHDLAVPCGKRFDEGLGGVHGRDTPVGHHQIGGEAGHGSLRLCLRGKGGHAVRTPILARFGRADKHPSSQPPFLPDQGDSDADRFHPRPDLRPIADRR